MEIRKKKQVAYNLKTLTVKLEKYVPFIVNHFAEKNNKL